MQGNSEDIKRERGEVASSGLSGDSSATQLADETGHMGPIERANLASLLGGIGQRLSELENRIKTVPSDGLKSPAWLEFSKIILGGWPVFGLVLLILFYHPIHDAINTIPGNLKSIGAFGVTLTMAVKDEAEKTGQLELSKTLPTLTPSAVAFMLRGSDNFNSLEKLNRIKNTVAIIWLPSDGVLKVLEELEGKRLIFVQINAADKSVGDLRRSIQDFKIKHPAKNHEFTPDSEYWELAEPVVDVPAYGWRFTELGKAAVSVIINVVSTQLAAGASVSKDKR